MKYAHLHPQVAALLAKVEELKLPQYWQLGAEGARAAHVRSIGRLGSPFQEVCRVEDRMAEYGQYSVPVRIYWPQASEHPLPMVVWFHGGGHVVGSVDSYDTLCRDLALKSGAIWISVDYRLAPEHKFPAAVEDSFAALQWVAREAASLGGDADRIAVAGDSAGGNLVAVCALLARDQGGPQLAFQLLIYPATAPQADFPSQFDYADDHFLTRETILWFHNSYLPNDAARQDFRYAPLIASSHQGLPPTLMILAECDPLRDEGLAYADKLREAGNQVRVSVYPGMIHPFFSMAGVFDQAREAHDEAARALIEVFGKVQPATLTMANESAG